MGGDGDTNIISESLKRSGKSPWPDWKLPESLILTWRVETSPERDGQSFPAGGERVLKDRLPKKGEAAKMPSVRRNSFGG